MFNKSKIIYLLILLFLLSMSACKKGKLITIEGVETFEIANCIDLDSKDTVVNTEDEYMALLDHKIEIPDCVYYELPEVDFEEKTILGQLTDVEACNALYQYEVLADLENEEYIYRVRMNLEQSSDCNERQKVSHWISIPKLPKNYVVKFETVLE